MNIFLISPKNVYATRRLVEEAANKGIGLTTTDIHDLSSADYAIDPASYDALYIRQAFMNLTRKMLPEELRGLVDLAKKFAQMGKTVVDEIIARGDIGQGKYNALNKLSHAGLSLPRTQLLSEIENEDQVNYPIIAKWNFGSRARHVFLIKSKNELEKIIRKYPREEILIQQFVRAEFEYKIFTAGYKSLPLALQLPTNYNKFLPDLKQVVVMKKEDVPEVVQLAETAAKLLGRELAKTDILQSGSQLYILEVNRRPGFHYFEQVTGYNVAQEFLSYICGKSSNSV